METKLQILAIGAIPFIIDGDQQKLIQYNNKENIVNFGDLQKHEGYYTAKFNKINGKLIVEPLILGNPNDNLIEVTIPGTILAVPAELPEEVKLSLNGISQKKEWGFYLGDEDLAQRLSGVLPHIDLAGSDFTVDWRLKELRETAQPWNSISLRDMDMSDDGTTYMTFYNTETHLILEADQFLFELPENVILLEIPNEILLDPVAVARSYGFNDTDMMLTYPIQKKLSAKITSITETGLADFIANNVKRRDDQQKGLQSNPGISR